MIAHESPDHVSGVGSGVFSATRGLRDSLQSRFYTPHSSTPQVGRASGYAGTRISRRRVEVSIKTLALSDREGART